MLNLKINSTLITVWIIASIGLCVLIESINERGIVGALATLTVMLLVIGIAYCMNMYWKGRGKTAYIAKALLFYSCVASHIVITHLIANEQGMSLFIRTILVTILIGNIIMNVAFLTIYYIIDFIKKDNSRYGGEHG